MVGISSWLAAQKEAGNLRERLSLKSRGKGRVVIAGPGASSQVLLDFSSNDYLALSEHPDIIEAAHRALDKYGAGAGAARLMSGNLAIYQELEEAVARLKGKEAGLLFGSGYMANIGIIPAFVGRDDVVFTDRLDHASIYDGCRLAGSRLVRFRHNDPAHLEERLRAKRGAGRALIVVESIYSMDGDRCPLPQLVELKSRYDCLLMVDEAHATGLFGPNGGGIIEEDGVGDGIDLAMGTFGKALGSYGAYVAASGEVIEYLVNRARSFVFSTALPPAVAAASLAAVKLVQAEPGLREELHAKAAFFKHCLRDGGIDADPGPSQIIPILIGESRKALNLSQALRERGVFATAVRPPTVPQGTARLRFSITRHLSREDLSQAAATLVDLLNNKA